MRRSTRVALFYFAVYALLCAAASPQGSSPEYRFSRIEVLLNGSDCDPVPDRISIVINASGVRKEYTLDKAGKNVWAVNTEWLPLTLGRVRWSGKTTECLPPLALERTNTLRFSFSGCFATQDVDFSTIPRSLESKYVRKLGSCIETVDVKGSRTAPFVGLNIEQLRLQLVPQPHDTAGGLSINKLLDLEEANASLEFRLTLDKVRHQLAVQRLHGDGAPPSLSSNAGALDVKKLEAANFESVTIKVH